MECIRKQLGVSLVELLVALAILAIALVPLLSVFLHALKTTEHSNKRTIAINLARDMLEEIRSKEFVEPGVSPSGGPATVGLETSDGYSATVSRLFLDDVDDYDGWCRGQDCECGGVPPDTGTSGDGLCDDNSALEAYDGTAYQGEGYPHYMGFTRRVEVFNIHPTPDQGNQQPREHRMDIGKDTARKSKKFNFYDLRAENFPNLTGNAAGNSRLKVVKVNVTYKGVATPDINIEDFALVVLPASKEE